MKQGTSRKITIIVLVALTALLGILAFVIAMRLREAQAPVDTSADFACWCTGDDQCPDIGWSFGGGGGYCDTASGQHCCVEGNTPMGDKTTDTGGDTGGGTPDTQGQCTIVDAGAGGDSNNLTCNSYYQCQRDGKFRTGYEAVGCYWSGDATSGECAWRYGTEKTAYCLDTSSGPGTVACGMPGVSVDCSSCSAGQGHVCQNDGSWSTCLNAHECGYVTSSGVDECGGIATGDHIFGRVDSSGNPVTCQDIGYASSVVCDYASSASAYRCLGSEGTSDERYFIGCGADPEVTAGATGAINDPTANCYQYVSSGAKVCVADEPYSCGTAVGAEAAPVCNETCTDICSDGTTCNPTTKICENPLCPGDSDCVCTVSSSSTTTTTTTTSTGTYACVEMTNQSGVTTIAPGQVIYFTERYSTTYATCPFTQSAVRLLVSASGTTATGVGGAYNNGSTPTSLLVPAVSLSTSVSGSTLYCDYNFVWQATNTNGTDVADGTYSVHYLTNTSDSSKVTTPAACVESLVVSSTEDIEPAFTLLKSSSAVCLDNGGATINYTVTARNVSSVSGALDRVTDDLPSEIPDNQISNISDSGVLSSGIITWTGPYTLAAGASRSFTYRATLTEAQVIALDEAPVYNKATIVYDTPSTQDNSIDFDLATYVTCLPGTGLFDSTEGLVLIGFILIIGGILFNRTGMAVVVAESGIGRAIGNLTSQVGSYESKVERAQERKIKSRRK